MTGTIRAQRPEDDPAVAALLTAAFADDGRVAALAQALRNRTDRGAALVAVDHSLAVVGVVQLSAAWVDAPRRPLDVLVLSPLAVTPSHQSLGIGGRLLTAATDAARELGTPLLFLEGDPGYYATRGWRSAMPLGFQPPSSRIPAAAFQVATLDSYDPAIMHGALVYNDTFWAHDCVGLR